jgi:hypothetical protein
MFTAEPSYFNFLMEHRCVRRVRVPFAQAVGVMPDLPRAERSRRWQRMEAAPLNAAGHFGRNIKSGL